MPHHVPGIVVAYKAWDGVVLLKPRQAWDLEQVAWDYAESSSDRGFWFAKFTWSAIDPFDQRHLTRPGGRFIRDELLGRVVVCSVEKSPKWRATAVQVEFKEPRFELPARRMPEAGGPREGIKKRARPGGLARMVLDGSHGGGLIFPPVGGRKPGSYRN